MCLTLSKKSYLIILFWVRYKITHRIEFESLHRNRSLRTLSIRIHARMIAVSCSILCSSRKIHSRRIRFLLTFWRTWSFESQITQFACWKWLNKSEMRLRKWSRNTMNNAIWLPNFRTKKKLCQKDVRMMILEQSKRRRTLFRRRKFDVLIEFI
jgi:hypothetical protein